MTARETALAAALRDRAQAAHDWHDTRAAWPKMDDCPGRACVEAVRLLAEPEGAPLTAERMAAAMHSTHGYANMTGPHRIAHDADDVLHAKGILAAMGDAPAPVHPHCPVCDPLAAPGRPTDLARARLGALEAALEAATVLARRLTRWEGLPQGRREGWDAWLLDAAALLQPEADR